MTYNIPRFHIRHYDLRHFAGPKAGEMAPDFEVEDLDGNVVRLSDFRGRWVVIEAASVTCSMYSRNVDAMQTLAERYPDTEFVLLYVREAHPGEKLAQHSCMNDKIAAAKRLKPTFGENRRVLIDNFHGDVHQLFGEMPNWVYLISPEGEVRYRCDWTHMSGLTRALEHRDRVDDDEHASMEDLSGRSMSHSIKTMKIGGWLAIIDFFRSLPQMIRQHKVIDEEYRQRRQEQGVHQ